MTEDFDFDQRSVAELVDTRCRQDRTDPQTVQATPASTRKIAHRISVMPVKDVLKVRMKDLDIKNVDLQKAIGYAKPNVIAMMKSGSMQLPANRVGDAARVLQLDPVFLLGKVIAENDPELWEVISALLGKRLVTANELELINHVRRGLNGHDIDLMQDPGFAQAVSSYLDTAAKRETAVALATINRKTK